MTVPAYHIPVLLQDTLELLAVKQNGVYVDCTFGGGGHSRAILEQLGDEGKLFAFDQDPDAAANAPDDPRFKLIEENFRYIKRFLRLEGIRAVDGILADLGVSSHQFDTAERGFSLRFDAPLDMRMNPEISLTAADIVNDWPEDAIADLLQRYGELPHSRRIARAICKARATEPILTTGRLNEVCQPYCRKDREHQTLARIYQALRIEVNQELEALKEMLMQATDLVKPGGRLVVISYHSLEDRLVKVFMRSGNFEDRTEKDFYGNDLSPWKPLTKKAIEPKEEEIATNTRSRSARLRAAERK
ncbi:ribosomal RNA small subunit methyltransferase H [Thermaurantimonas aggregans]|uniref:Ribosomal RNA small subunit methyltransferase H n=1 Tax=Thermaurantimonas aggregans TaxID=2173829 RepID=A0A401XLR7_9FLAO|nr:16S rRNA (cytosine(1402)-N(4))-methyltransferase RsmH [Thermaurantimonas aggregans]MCX8147816.1 16S rRNA (cytosine(1402)-N(4))-methyltransferase RsmH [Thermaurantimonas aggregans]GCD77934.1 ribosomal RNA small subunit methyltransferase H [Thermaurantimonas aggregans]